MVCATSYGPQALACSRDVGHPRVIRADDITLLACTEEGLCRIIDDCIYRATSRSLAASWADEGTAPLRSNTVWRRPCASRWAAS